MARPDNETIPAEHGIGSATAITVGEAGKGIVGGTFGGLWRGVLMGALVGAAVLGGIGFVLAGGLWGLPAIPGFVAPIAATIGAIGGGAIGGGIGTPTGAVVGGFQGISRGAHRVSRDNAAAQLARVQEKTAEAQMQTAQTLQAQVIERMTQPQPEPAAAPSAKTMGVTPVISECDHQGQGVKMVAQNMGAHSQRAYEQAMDAAQTQPQLG